MLQAVSVIVMLVLPGSTIPKPMPSDTTLKEELLSTVTPFPPTA